MINLQWGGHTNGSIPDSALSPIDSQGHKLEHTAAVKFLAMQAAMLATLGRTITVAPGADSAMRTLAQQQADYDLYINHHGNVAAVPGTSNHGWGRAVDITGYEVHDDVWAWLLAHAAEYGYSHATGALSGERWHWESYNTPGTITTAAASSSSLPTPKKRRPIMAAFVRSNAAYSVPWEQLSWQSGTMFLISEEGPLRPITAAEWANWVEQGAVSSDRTPGQIRNDLIAKLGVRTTDGVGKLTGQIVY